MPHEHPSGLISEEAERHGREHSRAIAKRCRAARAAGGELRQPAFLAAQQAARRSWFAAHTAQVWPELEPILAFRGTASHGRSRL